MPAKRISTIPSPPVRTNGPSVDWSHRVLYDRIKEALYALPGIFRATLNIGGIRVTDLYSLNTALGSSIEQFVVENLNELRSIWDPGGKYKIYSFVRQQQVFPDVLLQTDSPGNDHILMGIELKGWFLLAKEGEPSFRYKVSPSVCDRADLLVVFPWHLSEVISGTPHLKKPFVEEAKYAALQRNYYWQYLRGEQKEKAQVKLSSHQNVYPKKSDKFNDEAEDDKGNNFGRIARSGIMDSFKEELMKEPLAGIPTAAWQRFVKIFSDQQTEEGIQVALQRIRSEYVESSEKKCEVKEALKHLEEAARILLHNL